MLPGGYPGRSWAGSAPITTPVEHQQPEALIGERSLGLPLLDASNQRAVYEHHGRAGASRVYEEVAHDWVLLSLRIPTNVLRVQASYVQGHNVLTRAAG